MKIWSEDSQRVEKDLQQLLYLKKSFKSKKIRTVLLLEALSVQIFK